MPPKSKQLATVSEPAPWYKIPNQQFISIEHPCLVKNVSKGIDMLGGSRGIREALDPVHSEQPVSLSLHPNDPTSRPLISFNRASSNILLHITVPKRTGRKRKRGSDDAFEFDPQDPDPPQKDARYMLRSLKDNPEASEIEALGTIGRSHIFRSVPDFTYAVSVNPIVSEITSKILPLQYPLVKDFKLDLSTRHNTTYPVLPPPVFSIHSLPQNYSYRQNPAIKRTVDPTTNVMSTTNTSNPAKIFTYQLQFDTPSVPSSVDPSAPSLDTQPANMIGLVIFLQHLFSQRPIWTRRALTNQLPPTAPQFLLRYAIAYVAYAMRSGPWRDTYIRFGVDPRSSSDYRIYQTLLLQLMTSKREKKAQRNAYLRSWKTSTNKTSHIFNNAPPFPPDGKAWQLCDLTADPTLKSLVETPHIRETCETRYFGWYHNGSSAKLRIILKSKADILMDGKTPDDTLYTHLLNLPDKYTHNPGTGDYNFGRRARAKAARVASDHPHQASEPSTEDQQQQQQQPPPSPTDGSVQESDLYALGFLPKSASRAEMEFAATYRAMCRWEKGPSSRATKSLSRSQSAMDVGVATPAAGATDDADVVDDMVEDEDEDEDEVEEEDVDEEELDIDLDDDEMADDDDDQVAGGVVVHQEDEGDKIHALGGRNMNGHGKSQELVMHEDEDEERSQDGDMYDDE